MDVMVRTVVFVLFPMERYATYGLLSALFVVGLFVRVGTSADFCTMLFLIPIRTLLPLRRQTTIR